MSVTQHIMRIKRAAVIIIILCSCVATGVSAASTKVNTAASFYPLAHFAEHVAGEYADVTSTMPPGSDPHEYEPTPRDIKKIYEASIFLFNGAGVDPWAERLHNDLVKQGTTTIEMIKHFSAKELSASLGVHDNSQTDPHIWLDPILAIKEVEIIRDTFIKADPSREKHYRDNSTSYINKLNGLHRRYEDGLKSCRIRDIIVSHNAFGYLSARYNLNVHPITGISPEEEPSPRKMVALSKLALQKNITHILFEPMGSRKLANTIAMEVSADTLPLNPLGGLTGEDMRKGRTYISVMEDNLHNLRTAMGCE